MQNHHESVRFADLNQDQIVVEEDDNDTIRAKELRKVARRYKLFRPRHSEGTLVRVNEFLTKKEETRQSIAQFLVRLAPWQKLVEAVEFRHGVIVSNCIELHRWFLILNAVLFLPILIFVVIPQATTPANPVSPSLRPSDGLVFNRSANNFSCTSFRTCFAFSWFFLTPYRPMIIVRLPSFPYYNMQLAYLLSLAAYFLIGLCAASGIVLALRPLTTNLDSLPLFAWVFNAWNHEISNARLGEVTSSLVSYRLKEHLRLTVRHSETSEDENHFFQCSRRVVGVVFFEILFGLLFAATLVAVFYFYDLAEYAGVDGVVVETVGPLLATALPTFFLFSADMTAASILTGNSEKRLPLYQPWHLFFRAVLFRIAAIIVVVYRWTFCFPNHEGILLEEPPTTTTTTTTRRMLLAEDDQNYTDLVPVAVYSFKITSRKPPPFCPSVRDDTGWEVLVGRQVVLLSLYTAGFFLIESLLIFAMAQWRKWRQTKLLSARKQTLVTFPASRYAAYAVTLDLLSLAGAYFFPLSPALTAVLLLITFYSVTSLVHPRFSDSPVAFSWNNRQPGMSGSSDDEHVFRATVAIRFLRLFPYMFSGMFYMYIFYSVPVTPNCGVLRPPLNATASDFQPGIREIRATLIMPLVNVPVVGWLVHLLDQPPFAYLIFLALIVVAVFKVAHIVAVKQRLAFVTKQLVLAREDSNFLFRELQRARRRTCRPNS